MEPRFGSVSYLLMNAFYRMAYVEWGDPAAPPVLCVHGLTRTGRDFDNLARALADRFRVICPDLPGRGASDWLPMGDLYNPLSYVQALSHLLAIIDKPVAWVGTSLGGICGMLTTASHGNPVTRLVLNDIGSAISVEGLQRIQAYVAGADHSVRFANVAELEQHLRRIHGPFGPMTDADWAHLAATSARPLPDGGVALHYDPKIAEPIAATEPAEVDMRVYWANIRVPILAIRGQESDLLSPETFDEMVKSGAHPLVIPHVGHAPSLMDAPTIGTIRGFLEDNIPPPAG